MAKASELLGGNIGVHGNIVTKLTTNEVVNNTYTYVGHLTDTLTINSDSATTITGLKTIIDKENCYADDKYTVKSKGIYQMVMMDNVYVDSDDDHWVMFYCYVNGNRIAQSYNIPRHKVWTQHYLFYTFEANIGDTIEFKAAVSSDSVKLDANAYGRFIIQKIGEI